MKQIVGPRDALLALHTDPKSLRAQFGRNKSTNVIAVSHSSSSAATDTTYWYANFHVRYSLHFSCSLPLFIASFSSPPSSDYSTLLLGSGSPVLTAFPSLGLAAASWFLRCTRTITPSGSMSTRCLVLVRSSRSRRSLWRALCLCLGLKFPDDSTVKFCTTVWHKVWTDVYPHPCFCQEI